MCIPGVLYPNKQSQGSKRFFLLDTEFLSFSSSKGIWQTPTNLLHWLATDFEFLNDILFLMSNLFSKVRQTSHKPDEIYGVIERLAPGTRKIGESSSCYMCVWRVCDFQSTDRFRNSDWVSKITLCQLVKGKSWLKSSSRSIVYLVVLFNWSWGFNVISL